MKTKLLTIFLALFLMIASADRAAAQVVTTTYYQAPYLNYSSNYGYSYGYSYYPSVYSAPVYSPYETAGYYYTNPDIYAPGWNFGVFYPGDYGAWGRYHALYPTWQYYNAPNFNAPPRYAPMRRR